jgi:hypothetical protein
MSENGIGLAGIGAGVGTPGKGPHDDFVDG